MSQKKNAQGLLEDSKGATSGFGASEALDDGFDSYIFRNFIYGTTEGGLYGLGGHKLGYYRLNLDQNRIELDTDTNYSEVVLEYVADEARSRNPSIHVYAEEALRALHILQDYREKVYCSYGGEAKS